MKSKPLIVLLLFVLWGAGSTYWYVCQIKGFCHQQTVSSTVPTEPEQQIAEPEVVQIEKEFIFFEINRPDPVIHDSIHWQSFLEKLKNEWSHGKKLEIYGPYFPGEPVPESFENMGLLRAENLKKLIEAQISEIRAETFGRLIENEANGQIVNVYEKYFVWKTDNDFVREKEGKVLIYFPYNSNKEIRRPEIVNYMNELADKMKKNPGLKVKITGYTDNTGTRESNLWLGKKRAERIAGLLIKKGISKERMEIASGGSSNPIGDNSTREGRKQNRRVEIQIIQP